jgi:hypothetical protein
MKARMQPVGLRAPRGPVAMALALTILALTGTANGESLSPTYTYQTQGWVEQPPVGNDPWANRQPIQFSPVSWNEPLPQAPASFYLGSFRTLPHDLGGSYTFTDMPFGIKLVLDDGNAATTLDPVILISGVFNGTVTGNTISSMVASVTSILPDPWTAAPPFPLANLSIASITLNPPSVDGGWTPVFATLSVPEPSSFAVMGSLTLAFGLWARSRRVGLAG